MNAPATKLQAVLGEIDAANADDPRRIELDGAEHPFEIVYSRRMVDRLRTMYPDASELLVIAAYGQHLRRFDVSRKDYPEGRSGYNEWRRACREHHAELLAGIMRRHGYTATEMARVAAFVRKEQLKKDKDAQALENVVDVVFIQHYLADFIARYKDYDDDKLVDIIAKTLRKMSPKGHETVLALDLPKEHRRLIEAAVTREAETLARLAEVAVE